MQLPRSARLKSFANEAALQFFPLLNVSGGDGAVLMTGMAVRAAGPPPHQWSFLEGCMRLKKGGSPLEILSDGTEAYFYGSLYFDDGHNNYANDIAGMMQYYGVGVPANPGASATGGGADNSTAPHVAAYRFHDSERLLWHDNISLVWRSGARNQCTGDGPVLYKLISPVDFVSLVLAYVWDEQPEEQPEEPQEEQPEEQPEERRFEQRALNRRATTNCKPTGRSRITSCRRSSTRAILTRRRRGPSSTSATGISL